MLLRALLDNVLHKKINYCNEITFILLEMELNMTCKEECYPR
jgi:hypothetical protein